MAYVYRMVQIPPVIPPTDPTQPPGNEIAAYLENIVNSHAKQGWEFYGVDAVGPKVGQGAYVVTFRAQV
jgi:hypothetical protein